MNDSQKLLIFMGIFALPGLVVCGRLLRGICERGGRVQTADFGFPDLLLSFFLCGFFALLAVAAGRASAGSTAEVRPLTGDQITSNLIVFLGLVALIWGLLRWRKISPVRIFGLRRMEVWRAVLIGVLIVTAIYPLMILAGDACQMLLQDAAKEQEVVTYFRNSEQSGDSRSVVLLTFMAVIFQPAVEEFLFRGYFYGVFKGWAGPVASAIFTATLFATIHMTLVALVPLLIFALVLTLAYEWSGSLLVPISMHMVFNGVQLAMVTWGTQVVAR